MSEPMLSPGPISGAMQPAVATKPIPWLLWLALLILVVAAATILGALGFEHVGGYLPCHLCLMQRTPYYVGVPVAALTVLAVAFAAPRLLVAAMFAGFAALMLY